VAQYLLLYESAGGTEAQEYLSSDFQRARLELRLRLDMTSETVKLVESLEEELAERPVEATAASVTGIGALWLKLLDHIVTSQIRGFLLAFGAIAVLMCLVFRSVSTGIISMMPNLSPILLTLGVMGWWEIDLDYSKAAIAAVALGIAVDDTIHLVSRCRYEFQRCGNYAEALRAALADVGRALLITSIALVLGFLVLLGSILQSQATQGLLLATTILTALVADFLLMPALVLTFHPFGPEGATLENPLEVELRDIA
jgi:predicted RND superfamily exporter protein